MAANATDLLENIEWSSLECLNEQPQHQAGNALRQGYREDDGLLLESDTDEQLLINVTFQQKCKCGAISFKAPGDGSGPKTVKLYINRPSMGFSDVGNVPCAQQLSLTPEQLASGEQIPLKLVKFTSVTFLSIFVEDNQGDEDTTKIQRIQLFGSSGADSVFDVAQIKKTEGK